LQFYENKVDENISTNGLWIIESKDRDFGGQVDKYSEIRLKNLQGKFYLSVKNIDDIQNYPKEKISQDYTQLRHILAMERYQASV
jgi:hypothetical protein